MKSMLKRVTKHVLRELFLLIVGGIVYMGIEMLWRGRTHWSMGIVGGICFVLIGLLNETYTYEESMELQALKSSAIVTVIEFISGCIINLKLGWNVWDYSNMPLNLFGQVCLLFMVLWFFLAFVAIYLDDCIRYLCWKEPYPKYIWATPKLLKRISFLWEGKK